MGRDRTCGRVTPSSLSSQAYGATGALGTGPLRIQGVVARDEPRSYRGTGRTAARIAASDSDRRSSRFVPGACAISRSTEATCSSASM
jgi:hypothetical protein